MSDFGRLRIYGRFLIPVHALVWTAVTAGGSYSASLVAAVISTLGRWGWVGIRLAVHNQAAACVAAGGGIFENQL